jgi:integrase
MLDKIDDDNGPVMADRTLAHLRKALNWHATRDQDFNSPIVKGMARTKPKQRERKRNLNHDEIRDLWAALDKADAPAPYAAFIRTLLLTGQRRNEVAGMRWDEIEEHESGDVWVIPPERYKTKVEQVVPLTQAVRQIIIGEKPKKKGKDDPEPGPFVFSTTNGDSPFSGYSKAKPKLDAKIAEARNETKRGPMPHWTLHDLRRTAKRLMLEAGVRPHITERVLGHVIGGVEGNYDQHDYKAEKRTALEQLAAKVGTIINPPKPNVTSLQERRRKRATA